MIHKAKIKGTEEWVKGYYRKSYYPLSIMHLIHPYDHPDCCGDESVEIDPTTLQVQLTNGEFAPVDEAEIIPKIDTDNWLGWLQVRIPQLKEGAYASWTKMAMRGYAESLTLKNKSK